MWGAVWRGVWGDGDASNDAGVYRGIMEQRHENVVTAFAYTDHQVISFVANQPQVFATCLDIDSSEISAASSGWKSRSSPI